MKYCNNSKFINTIYITVQLLCLATGGCTIGGVMSYSKIEAIPADKDINVSNNLIHIPGLILSIIPYNYYSNVGGCGILVPIIPLGFETKSEYSNKPFHISFEFEAEEEEFSVDPKHITLRYNKHEYFPVKISCQHEGKDYRRSHSAGAVPGHEWECVYETHRVDREDMYDINEVRLKGRTCFIVEFPINTIHPSKKFSLLINGLKKSGNSIIVPEIFFEKKSTYEYEMIGN